MSLPGAGPPNSAERLAAALKSQSVNTGRGAVQTRSATRRPPTAPYNSPILGAGAVCTAEWDDGSVGATFGLLPHTADFNNLDCEPRTVTTDFFSTGIAGGKVTASIIAPGWYSLEIAAVFDGTLAAGDAVKVEGVSARFAQICVGYGAYISGTPTVANGSTSAFYAYEADLPYDILGVASGPTGAYVTQFTLWATRWTGPALD